MVEETMTYYQEKYVTQGKNFGGNLPTFKIKFRFITLREEIICGRKLCGIYFC